MVEAYNFLASWQLFPEKGTYKQATRPRSGIFKMSLARDERKLLIDQHWVSLEGEAYSSHYSVVPDGSWQDFEHSVLADKIRARFISGIHFETVLSKADRTILEVQHEIMPNGYLRISSKTESEDGDASTSVEIYHKQLSVLPYAAAVSGAVIKATEEGVIRHKALTAMEEQTNMQLEQIRRQVELLALQAQEIQRRKDLSLMIYSAQMNFAPVIGQTYYVYERKDGSHLLSMLSPANWGSGSGPFKKFIAAVQLLADHTWLEIL